MFVVKCFGFGSLEFRILRFSFWPLDLEFGFRILEFESSCLGFWSLDLEFGDWVWNFRF